ncbi:MAG: hypothetical protein R6W78_03640 [Bacteroidales bacterium]
MVRMIRLIIVLQVFILASLSVSSQDLHISSFTKELNVKFTTLDEKKIERGIVTINEAEKLLSEAQAMYDALSELEKKEKVSVVYQKSLKKIQEASEKHKEGYQAIHLVFKEKCNEFWNAMRKVQHFAAGVEKGRYYEKQAVKQKAMSAQRRDQVLWTDRFEYAKLKSKEANELDMLIIRDQGRALQVYSDYPVEYNYGWENDVTLEEIKQIYKNPAVNEPPEDIYATVNTEAKVDPVLMEEIIFKVQIAAHTVPLTEEYLRSVYKGTMPMDMIYEDDWYKYSIGRYHSFTEANITLQECGVRKAFIVAYQGGKKLTIQEALGILEQNPL